MTNKTEQAIRNLKLACFERLATAEHFETTIKVCGLTYEIMNIIRSYYKVDLESYEEVSF